jgi:hypothetical protein
MTPRVGHDPVSLPRTRPSPLGAGVHLLTLLAGGIFILRIDRHIWFFDDDWDFLLRRGLHHPARSIWQPHNEHWSTLPILLYRALFTLFGLRDFTPYLVPVIVAHLIIAHLIWRMLRRFGVDPWMATGAVLVFIFLGAGAENLTWAFQIGFVGSVMFGLAAMDVAVPAAATSSPPSWRRTAVTAVLLMAALMCSTVGDAMVAAVGVAILLAAGWRSAARTLLIPVAGYAVWFLLVGRYATNNDKVTISVLLHVPGFVLHGLAYSIGKTFGLPAAGPVLLVLLAAWVALEIFSGRSRPEVLGLVAGVVTFLFIVSLARQDRAQFPSRYIYIVMAMLWPLTVVALVSVARRLSRVPLVLLLAVLVAVNISSFEDFTRTRNIVVQSQKTLILSVGTLLRQGRRSLNSRPIRDAGDLSAADILQLERQGQLPMIKLTAHDRHSALAGMEVTLGPLTGPHGDLRLVRVVGSTMTPGQRGCDLFRPTSSAPELVLRGTVGEATVAVDAVPASPFTFFVGAPPGEGGATVMLPSGRASLYEAVGPERLAIRLPKSSPTTVCGLRLPPTARPMARAG